MPTRARAESSSADSGRFGIVVIGASAGGHHAMREILRALPPSFELPIVLVLHLNPRLPSVLARVLGHRSPLRVTAARDGDVLRAGTVYVATPDRHLEVTAAGGLHLSAAAEELHNRPSVNHLFESAAVTYGRGTIAVVLSGSGNDGAEGVRVVRDAGGVVIVQEPDSALFAGMPEAAINTGIAAYVLPCAEIARLLVALARGDHPVESAFAHAPVA